MSTREEAKIGEPVSDGMGSQNAKYKSPHGKCRRKETLVSSWDKIERAGFENIESKRMLSNYPREGFVIGTIYAQVLQAVGSGANSLRSF